MKPFTGFASFSFLLQLIKYGIVRCRYQSLNEMGNNSQKRVPPNSSFDYEVEE